MLNEGVSYRLNVLQLDKPTHFNFNKNDASKGKRTQSHIVLNSFLLLTLIPGQSLHCQQQRLSLLWISASEIPETQKHGELLSINMFLFFLSQTKEVMFLVQTFILFVSENFYFKIRECIHTVTAFIFKQMQQDIVAAIVLEMLLDALLCSEPRPSAVEFTVP